MPKHDYQEKRRFTRIAIQAQISFTINDHDELSYKGIIQNLCACRVYIITNHPPKLGNHIKIILNENDGSSLIAEGNVVRCKFDKKDPNLFHVSAEFSETDQYLEQTITNSMVNIANNYG